MAKLTPEQLARENIDQQLIACGWIIQNKNQINLSASKAIPIREYQPDARLADYVLFVNRMPVRLIEAKQEEKRVRLTTHENQSGDYARTKLKRLNHERLSSVYESTGEVTRFIDHRDPKPRSRPVFTLHWPETFAQLLREPKTLLAAVFDIPTLQAVRPRDCKVTAIADLEKSFRENRPKSLVQMATGLGKTFTVITFIYRLLKCAKPKCRLFLVDTKNLDEQAEQEFLDYVLKDDNGKLTDLYAVTRFKSSFIPTEC